MSDQVFPVKMLSSDESFGSHTGGGNFYLFKGVPEEQAQEQADAILSQYR